ncbi:MAG: hypothetical protein ACYTFW_06515 [Planctomycetota bacterium]|jgi:hypothetical protein
MSEAIEERIKNFNEETKYKIESETIKLISELGEKVTKKYKIGNIVFTDSSSGVYEVYLTPEGIGYGQDQGSKFVPNISTKKLIADVYRYGTGQFPLFPFLKALEDGWVKWDL